MSQPARKIVIAVDGPAAAGKGTFARALAAKLGYSYLDTGALYRIIALDVLQRGDDPAKVLHLITFPLMEEQLTNVALRTPEVGEVVAKVAVIPEVRAAVRAYQLVFMQHPTASGVVLDGRDIGTVVCPDAEVKFFVTASAEVRARRRFVEQKDGNPGLTLEKVLADINARDAKDRDREFSPLRAASDAHVLDTSSAAPAETLEEGLAIVKAKLF